MALPVFTLRVLDRVGQLLRRATSERVTLDGICFDVDAEGEERRGIEERLVFALTLLSDVDPRALARLRANVKSIFIGDILGWLSFDHRLRTLEISRKEMLGWHPRSPNTALALIHGAAEARLSRGVATTQKDREERVVRLAWRAQLASARRWAAPAVIEWLEEQQTDEDLFMSAREVHDRSVELIRSTHAPQWMIRVIDRIAKRRLRKSLH